MLIIPKMIRHTSRSLELTGRWPSLPGEVPGKWQTLSQTKGGMCMNKNDTSGSGFNVYTCSLTSNVHTCMHTPSHTRAHKHTCTLLSPSPKILFFLSLRSQPPICLCVSEVALWDMSVALTGLESTMEIRLALNLWHAFFLCFVEYWDYRHMPALWLISSVLISLSRQKWWRKY